MNKINEGIVDFKERKMLMVEDNIHALESVKEILMISNTDFMTVKMVADYYEVGEKAINSLIFDNKEELMSNGLFVAKRKDINSFLKLPEGVLEKYDRYKDVIHNDGEDIFISNRGLTLISKRVLLNIGMLLRDSEIAKELRKRLLDIVHDADEGHADTQTIIDEIDEETQLKVDYVNAMMSGNINQMNEINAKLFELKNKRIEELEGIVKSSRTIEDSKDVINRCIRTVATSRRYHNNYANAWNDFYSILNYNLNTNIKKRNKIKGSYLNSLTEEELKQAEIAAKAWVEEKGLKVKLELA